MERLPSRALVRPLFGFLLGAAGLWGCGPLVSSSPAIGPAPAELPTQRPGRPVRTPTPPAEPEVSGRQVLPGPGPDSLQMDPILDSPWARTREMEARIQEWIQSFQTREARLFRQSLERMGHFSEVVDRELRAQGLPKSLAYLPIVESWYNPRAVSWVGAAGLWQFMPSTAREMGLNVDRLVDERRDPYLSTPLALAYLSDLRGRFDSWFLALAAYNGGPGRLTRILGRVEREGAGHDGLFLEILHDLPRETRDFVPRFLAAARVARNPGAYGFGDVVPDPPWSYDEIMVPDATSLDVVARAGDVDQNHVEELNPQLLRGLTPAGVSTHLRLPPGAGARFEAAYALIPPEERVTFLEHSVTRGETLTHIARRYGVSVGDLRATNPTLEPRRMQIGQRVVVPKAPSVRGRVAQGGGEMAEGARVVMYQVRSGDTLSAIAARHRVGVSDLLRWNSLSRSSIIRPGDQVKIVLPGG